MWRSERDIDGAIKGNVQDRPANRQNSTEVAPNHFRTPQRTSMESTNRASEAKAGTERKAFAARLHAVHSHRTLLKRPRRASSFFGRHCSPKGTSPTSRSYAFRYLAQHSVDGLSPQKERLATMICPISKRFLGHFFAPPQRPVWFRLPAKPIQLAVAKPPSAAACFRTGATSLRNVFIAFAPSKTLTIGTIRGFTITTQNGNVG